MFRHINSLSCHKHPSKKGILHLEIELITWCISNFIFRGALGLYSPGIRPTRVCSKIKKEEFPKIFQAIKDVLAPAIASGGTTFQGGYRDSTGERGMGVQHLVVFYQKTCQLCGVTPVKKIILAQRGTYYCPKCQK